SPAMSPTHIPNDALCHLAGDSPALHAFPTRRSSDLGGADPGGGGRAAPLLPGGAGGVSEGLPGGVLPAGVPLGGLPGGLSPGLRSEEHTSELQSRFELVCRLLLEKKKTDEDRARRQG